VLAGGKATVSADRVEIKVAAKEGDADWGIVQSPFLRDNARTIGFEHCVQVTGNIMTYKETTFLDIYGGKSFNHTDGNTLTRI
jgi:hypothetical protein